MFERLALNQLIVYINEEALLDSRFRKGHSTTTVLLGIRYALIRASSRGEVTLMVCSDYSKAFDTVQCRSVVCKMHSLGFLKYFFPKMIDYLTQRRQLVQIDDRKSDMAQWNLAFLRAQFWVQLFSTMYHIPCNRRQQIKIWKLHCFSLADASTFQTFSLRACYKSHYIY